MKTREEVLTSFVEVKPEVDSVEEAAEAMGMTFAGLDKALARARAAGDARGVYQPLHIRRLVEDRRARRHQILAGWEALPHPRPTYAVAAAKIGCTRSALATTLSRARLAGVTVSPSIDREAVLEDWEILRDADEHWERAATRLGLTRGTFAQILHDARESSDPRGHLTRQEAS